MDATQIVVAAISAIATILASGSIVKTIGTWFGNRRRRRRNTIAWLESRVELERTKRRRFEEYSSRLRRQMIERGIPESEIYPWPKESTPKEMAP